MSLVKVVQGTHGLWWWASAQTLTSASCCTRRCHLRVVSWNIVQIVSVVIVGPFRRSLIVLGPASPLWLRLRLTLSLVVLINSSLFSSVWLAIFLHYVKQLLLYFWSSSVKILSTWSYFEAIYCWINYCTCGALALALANCLLYSCSGSLSPCFMRWTSHDVRSWGWYP
jgi:hypothetical protein